MVRYIVGRLVAAVPVLLGASVVVFVLMQLVPGDTADALFGPQASLEHVQRAREMMGLDAPTHVRYVQWLSRAVVGDLGVSITLREPVAELVWERFKNTALLAFPAIVLAAIFGMAAGIVSAVRHGSLIDRGAVLASLFLTSMPPFWLGLLLIFTFSLRFEWLPVSGMFSTRGGGDLMDLIRHMVLPTLTLSAWVVGIIARVARSTMLEIIDADYLRTARAKGLSEWTVIVWHGFRNALLPVVTTIGLQAGNLLGGAVLTETVFNWPGLGHEISSAIAGRDMPVVLGGILVLATVFIAVNLAVDLLYSLLDPRIRYG